MSSSSTTNPAAKTPWTKEIWFYDYRTNIHHTLKKNTMKLQDLQDFITVIIPQTGSSELKLIMYDNPEEGEEVYVMMRYARDQTV
jgi:type I restriction enzyme M protein